MYEKLTQYASDLGLLKPMQFWQEARECGDGSGKVTAVCPPQEGEGVFWKDGREGAIFLFSPQRALSALEELAGS